MMAVLYWCPVTARGRYSVGGTGDLSIPAFAMACNESFWIIPGFEDNWDNWACSRVPRGWDKVEA